MKSSEEFIQSMIYGEPLITAVTNGYLDIIKILTEYGADINCEDLTGVTPLIASIKSGWLDCVKFLVNNNVKVESNYNNKSISEIARDTGSKHIYAYVSEHIN